MASEKLDRAIALIKAGNKPAALSLLKEIIRADPRDENAWLWLSACVDQVDQKKFCLQKVLEINPANLQAQNALRRSTELASSPVHVEAPRKAATSPPGSKTRLATARDKSNWFLGLSIVGFFLILITMIGLYMFRTGQLATLTANLPFFPSVTLIPSLPPPATLAGTPSLPPTATWTATSSPTVPSSPTPPAIATDTLTVPSNPSPASLVNCAWQNEIPAAECEALTVFFQSTNGAGWKNNTGWLRTGWPCSWYGVFCQDDHVSELQMESNNLSGFLPAQLGNLTHLKYLYLNNNHVAGFIPAELGNLTALMELGMDNNLLTGTIPTELGNLTNLTDLDLGNNHLTGSIPTELGNLTALTTLGLNGNLLTGSIPTQLGSLTHLTRLSLSGNRLSGSIPAELGGLASLQILDMDNNPLTGSIPDELGNLKQLQALFLGDTWLTGEIPASFVNLVNLSSLTLACGVTSSNPTVISFIDGILGPGWDVTCPTPTPAPTPTSDINHSLYG
ncbi:MAG TPA: leucine-rich repeat domain-containing protein [Anaerolineales bacterium]|nr:leucine-rich repeat domain-containing protein [Anaerolineales bacterium]